ncbi:helix-turn-helix domain-containing protein [Bradyrhizobium sp. CCGUVB23]|uniref:helix-turn-helix domain-containing protein n=1 Tax=Bradyrhizobium sp. CCGUVB23 TaxID=2949630 RepID=UPI0020B215B7|nr:helix-turn-helix domain-containing protein [Bradyrhizobium sp. CCGUVB23]MCP3462614.1 helix-turn-helix domain-containing protein [Bradyrhizobium sp. CCGUVB23]
MSDNKFLTAEEVSERYRGSVSVGTLRNWRAMRIGPTFVKIGKAVLYPTNELDAWDQKNTVSCRASKRPNVDDGKEA